MKKLMAALMMLSCLPLSHAHTGYNYHSKLYSDWKESLRNIRDFTDIDEDDVPNPPNPELAEGICDKKTNTYCIKAVKICGDDQNCKNRIITNNICQAIFTKEGVYETAGQFKDMIDEDDIEGMQGILDNVGSYIINIESFEGSDFITWAVYKGRIKSLEFLLTRAKLDVNYVTELSRYSKPEVRRASRYDPDEHLDLSPLVYAREKMQAAREKNDRQSVTNYENIIKLLKKHGALELIPGPDDLPLSLAHTGYNYQSKLYLYWKKHMRETRDFPAIDEDDIPNPQLAEGICDKKTNTYCIKAVKICGDDQSCKSRIITNNILHGIFTMGGAYETENKFSDMIYKDDIEGMQGILDNVGSYIINIESFTTSDFITWAVYEGRIKILEFLLTRAKLDVNYVTELSGHREARRASRYDPDDEHLELSPLVYAREKMQAAREKNDRQSVTNYENIIKLLKKHGALELIPEPDNKGIKSQNIMGDPAKPASRFMPAGTRPEQPVSERGTTPPGSIAHSRIRANTA